MNNSARLFCLELDDVPTNVMLVRHTKREGCIVDLGSGQKALTIGKTSESDAPRHHDAAMDGYEVLNIWANPETKKNPGPLSVGFKRYAEHCQGISLGVVRYIARAVPERELIKRA